MEFFLIMGIGLSIAFWLFDSSDKNLQQQEIPVEKDENERRK